MKKQTNYNFVKLNKEQTIELTTTVNETIAADFDAAKIFSNVDLWNIQRRSKTTGNYKRSAFSYREKCIGCGYS